MPYSNSHLLTSPPLGLTVALSVAEVSVIDEAVPVSAVASGGLSPTTSVAPVSWYRTV